MIQTIATFIISIIILSTLFELIRTYIHSLFNDSNNLEDDINEKQVDKRKCYDSYINDNPIWFETSETIITPILFRRNYYAENLKTLRRYKYKTKYNKRWKNL